MRHGQTDYNRENRYTGTTDIPLNATGRAQARAAGTAPNIRHLYVSPLRRARETARICFPAAAQTVVDGLREMDFGDFSGANAQELSGDPRFAAWHDSAWALPAPHGESRGTHQQRVIAALTRIVADEEAAGAPVALAVAHGGVVMAACDGLLPAEETAGRGYLSWNPGNCALTCFDVDHAPNGSLRLSHLQVHRTVDFLRDL